MSEQHVVYELQPYQKKSNLHKVKENIYILPEIYNERN
jgi:hypothetical protein